MQQQGAWRLGQAVLIYRSAQALIAAWDAAGDIKDPRQKQKAFNDLKDDPLYDALGDVLLASE